MAQKLTQYEQSFVNEFIKDLNPVLACERLGCDELLAMDTAYEFLGKQYIQDALAEALLAHKKAIDTSRYSPQDLGITDGYIMMRLKSIADRAAKPAEQLKALELLGKSIGLFKENSKMEIVETKKRAFSSEDRARMLKALQERKAHGLAK